MTTLKELGLAIYRDPDGTEWIKDESKIVCEVLHSSDGETNDEMYEAGYLPVDLQCDQWITEFDYKSIFL